MPDNNRFAGLSEGLDGEDDEVDEVDAEESAAAADTDAEADTSTGDERSADTVVSDVDDAGDEAGGPAFEFDETTAKSIYVREETLDVLEDTEFEVEMLLRKEHAIRDVTGREFHDAVVRVIESHPEEVVDAILAARDD